MTKDMKKEAVSCEANVGSAYDRVRHHDAHGAANLNFATPKEIHLLDVYDSLGVRWGDDVFAAIGALKQLRAPGVPTELVPSIPHWQPIETAPEDGMFLVYTSSIKRTMVADGRMLMLSRKPNTPKHLSGHHWTHWMPLPAAPGVPQEKL